MTCDEFMEMVERDPLDMSRAERAATIVHGRGCRSCFERLKEDVKDDPEPLLGLQATYDKMTEEDMRDPEYRGVIGD